MCWYQVVSQCSMDAVWACQWPAERVCLRYSHASGLWYEWPASNMNIILDTVRLGIFPFCNLPYRRHSWYWYSCRDWLACTSCARTDHDDACSHSIRAAAHPWSCLRCRCAWDWAPPWFRHDHTDAYTPRSVGPAYRSAGESKDKLV